MGGPLAGYTVIEFATYVAGPSASRILADWGARVIKVESFRGDGYRTNKFIYNMPSETDLEDPCFDVVAVNKEFLALDLRTPEGKKVFDDLLKDADVLLTNTRHDSMERLGYAYDQVKERFSRLVYAHMLGYGEQGEKRGDPGYDYVCYGARGGVTGSLYERGGAPMIAGPGFGDLQAGMCLAAGVLGALLQREHTGRGDRVSVSLHGVGVYMLHLLHSAAQDGYRFPVSRREFPAPTNNTYQAKDGSWIQICVPDFNHDYNRFVCAIGRDDLVDDPLYCTIETLWEGGRLREFTEVVERAFLEKTAEEWACVFRDADLAYERCFVSSEVLEDPEIWANEFAQKVVYPTGNERTVFNNPIRLDSLGVPEFRPSRGVGADTESILRSLGYSDAAIFDLEHKNVVVQHG